MYKQLQQSYMAFIKSNLPRYQHYYDYIYHNKVDSLYCYAVPHGKKYLAWFTLYKSKPICFLIELKHNNIDKVIVKPISFNKQLSLNTLLYGVLYNNNFIIEDIFYFRGENLLHKNNINKLSIYRQLFKFSLNKHILVKHQVTFSLPIFSLDHNYLDKAIIPYKTYGVCFVYLNKYCLKKQSIDVNYKLFNVKADKINDIYYLFSKDNKLYDIALVDSFKTSKYLNNLFRKIKENNNLDLLEESDDEEVFENISDNKYILKVDSIEMLCYYNKKCNKWVPIIKK
jgi:hypothetical protein